MSRASHGGRSGTKTDDIIQRLTERATKREECGKTAPISLTTNHKQRRIVILTRDHRLREGW